MSDTHTLAYLAGVFDSDGYITIHRSTRNGSTYYAARAGIAGTRREPHDLAASIWGGNVGMYKPSNPRHRPQYQWSRSGTVAYTVINDVLPYLRVKREQAQLALELQEHVWDGAAEDAFPWFGPDYDPNVAREALRAEVVEVLNQDRRAPRAAV